MPLVNGVLIERGDEVKISGIYAHNDSYTCIIGRVCTYVHPAVSPNKHHVKCYSSGIWMVRDADIQPLKKYSTNKEAKRLLEADTL